eukprot:NODE_10867_length_426_cov_3.180371_g9750_i0.p2 GENE.NODE_10867_length_426_cov_3.180371_g9750_i0~~NODE_10867_length_426_cov_3.180371_g9750_i0.p2  ORF type:complete len:63 (+),score=4.09 NODE_10867_length_426_cov_3.180371_g9750_i0:105-293(+)
MCKEEVEEQWSEDTALSDPPMHRKVIGEGFADLDLALCVGVQGLHNSDKTIGKSVDLPQQAP